ncbi:transcription termination factor NusA [Culicoidibacter larvae]|uniref:Transcription termination/antitermination protein NusA n=1 Tax=Culicoidibacter larvae TaxID=2579976 RepID=A0A5R8QEV1_9FIRM|nr:transcription termination factor NusA [Culicoidibacter larvae]TLG76502.1 transcription termination/antitermination protein NusA [Culicoidibacter larvae]
MNTKEFLQALDTVEKEKGIDKAIIIESIEHALVSAYKKNFDQAQNVEVTIDAEKGKIVVYSLKTVVEEVEEPLEEISLDEAKTIKKTYKTGDVIREEVTPKDFGRIAAQTAKQIVLQSIKEAERDVIYNEYIDREDEIITGIVTSIDHENGNIYVNIGRTEALLSKYDQIASEKISHGDKIDVYLSKVERTTKGSLIRVSRTHPGLLKRLFEREIPEISNGLIEVKNIVREAGDRSKVAVYSDNPTIDAVGACIGPKRMRIQAIIDEVNEEKIDIVLWSDDPVEYITNALSPASVSMVLLDEDDEEHESMVIVPDNQLSLAIGKKGQNARLAARLTGWKIDIKSETEAKEFGIDFEIEQDDIAVIEDIIEDEESDVIEVVEAVEAVEADDNEASTTDEE